ncbi:sulfatase-like hydrolase/transferase [Stappia sp.]|uniref:sulfatase-like hydrolase/transferase n=1 Tax=Stappia sp. TaxID=1870903 RepID=UPI003A990F6A
MSKKLLKKMPEKTKKNVLLIVADQWRGDHLPSGWGGDMELPNLSRLASEGTLLARHYCNASPCGPARMSMLTGQYPMNHRVVQNGVPLRDGKTNLALEFRKHGMLTGLVGYTSWIPDPHSHSPKDPRFSMYGANMPGFVPVRSFEEPEFEAYFGYLRTLGYVLPDNPFDIWSETVTERGIKPSPICADHSDTAWMTDAAVDFIRGRQDQPWSLFVGYWKPHPPLSAAPPYCSFADPAAMADPVRAGSKTHEAASHPVLAHLLSRTEASETLQGLKGLAADLPLEAIRNARAVYRGLMKEIDDNIGRLMSCLEDCDLLEDTLVVFTSDHGEMLGDHYQFGKESYFEGAFHVPFIIRDPRPSADALRGQVLNCFTEHVDIMPTALDFIGAPVPRQCDGRSLNGLLSGAVPKIRDHAFMEVDFRDLRSGWHESLGIDADYCGASVLRGERFKYVHFAAFEPILFDLEIDPDETRNCARDPDRREDVIASMSAMLNWKISSADRTLTTVCTSKGGLVGWPNERDPSREHHASTSESSF